MPKDGAAFYKEGTICVAIALLASQAWLGIETHGSLFGKVPCSAASLASACVPGLQKLPGNPSLEEQKDPAWGGAGCGRGSAGSAGAAPWRW
eukprot:10048462-Alexandrium_andersonii.AAC.1